MVSQAVLTEILAPRKPTPHTALGARIALLRQRARLTQREFARRAGISEGYPPKIESGESRPEPDVLRDIARALGTSYADLAVLAGYMNEAEARGPSGPPIETADVFEDMYGYPREWVERAKRWLQAMVDSEPIQRIQLRAGEYVTGEQADADPDDERDDERDHDGR